MPTLPTLTVTDAQATRITAAFGSVAQYKAWLKKQVIEFVLNSEAVEQDELYAQEREAKKEQARQDLGGIQ